MDPARRLKRIGALLLGLVLTVVVVSRGAFDIEWSLESLRSLVDGLGLWGPAVFVLLLALRSVLLIPSQLLLVGAGVCFGVTAGTLYGAVGVTLSGALAFGVARWLGRDALLAQVPLGIRGFLDSAGSRSAAAVVFVGTAYPVGPISAYHAGAALTGMSALGFLAAVAPGAVIRAGVYAVFGSRLGDGDLDGVLLFGAALLLLTIPLLVPGWRRWLLARLIGPAGPAGPAPPAS